MSLSQPEKEQLAQAARQVAQFAYAPYSHFRVGAAILGENVLYTGVNVENASYGLTLCAERSAFSHAVTQGERNFKAIAVACIDAPNGDNVQSLMPCGACLQWIAELAPQADIIVCGKEQIFQFSLKELLPLSFNREWGMGSRERGAGRGEQGEGSREQGEGRGQ